MAETKQLPYRSRYFFDQLSARGPFDWKQFYRFIYAAHRGRLKRGSAQIADLLSYRGFDAQRSAQLALIYEHGRALLQAKPALNDIKLKASGFNPDKSWGDIIRERSSGG
jgi:hypothetical protein